MPDGAEVVYSQRDRARQPRARHRRARAAPRRPARRAHAAEADDRGLRHPRQDDDVEHGRPRAARRRGRPELPGRRRGALDRRQRRLGRRGSGWSSRPTSPTARCSSSHPTIAVVTNAELDHHTTYASAARRATRPSAPSSRCAEQRSSADLARSPTLDVFGADAELTAPARLRLRRRDGRAPGARARTTRATPPRRSTAIRLAGADVAQAAAALATSRARAGASSALGTTHDGALVVDDYAHHPTEVARDDRGRAHARARAASSRVFQPHLFSRTQREAERVRRGARARPTSSCVLDVYPARERAEDFPGRHRPAGRRRRPRTPAGGKRVVWMPHARDARARSCKRELRDGRPAADDGRRRRRRARPRAHRGGTWRERGEAHPDDDPAASAVGLGRSASGSSSCSRSRRRLAVAARLEPRRRRATSQITGVTASDGEQVRAALETAAQDMTTLHVREQVAARGRRAVRVGRRPAASRPTSRTRCTIQVIERRPVAALAGARRAPDPGHRRRASLLRGVTRRARPAERRC